MIDNQGKILGRLNIIDFFIILFLLSLLPLGYFGYQAGTKMFHTAISPPVNFFEAHVTCLFNQLTSDLLSKISVGDIEKDEQGFIIGEILTIKQPQPTNLIKRFGPYLGKYSLHLYSPTDLFEIESSLRLKIFTDKNRFAYYKNRKNLVKPNELIEFKTDQYKLICTVLE